VDVVVSDVDIEKRRLSLSLRATEPNPWEQVADTYHVGSRIHGVVRNLTDFGAFVEIVPGVDGLVHISDMSWTRRINHPSEVVQKGQEVDAVITAIDIVNQRISLSMKELLPNEWEEYANSHSVGDVAGGTVTNVTDFGVFVELAPGVEGLCHISEIDRDSGLSLAEMFIQGQRVRCRILRIDWNENRIGLSMHGVSQEGAEEEAATPTSDDEAPQVETAMAAALRAGGIVVAEADDETPEEGEESAAAPDDEASEEGDESIAAPDVEASEQSEESAAVPDDEAPEEGEESAAAPDVETSEEGDESIAAPDVEAPEEGEGEAGDTAETDATAVKGVDADVSAAAADETQDTTDEDEGPPVESGSEIDALLAREGITGDSGVPAQESAGSELGAEEAREEEPPADGIEEDEATAAPASEDGADTSAEDAEKTVEKQES